jgi:hypothetical protein
MNRRRLLVRLLNGSRNVSFHDLMSLAEGFGFRLSRIRGSHHFFVHPAIPEVLNLQPMAGKAKRYQVDQLLDLVEQYDLRLEEDQ